MFKESENVSAPTASEIFEKKIIICTTCEIHLNPSRVHSVFHDTDSISYLGPQIWSKVPLEMKKLTTINVFKKGS